MQYFVLCWARTSHKKSHTSFIFIELQKLYWLFEMQSAYVYPASLFMITTLLPPRINLLYKSKNILYYYKIRISFKNSINHPMGVHSGKLSEFYIFDFTLVLCALSMQKTCNFCRQKRQNLIYTWTFPPRTFNQAHVYFIRGFIKNPCARIFRPSSN